MMPLKLELVLQKLELMLQRLEQMLQKLELMLQRHLSQRLLNQRRGPSWSLQLCFRISKSE